LESLVKNIVKEKQPFERLELTKDQLLEMFNYNEFKVRILKEKVDTPTTTVYRCGPLIDLCRGPHIRHTGKVKALAVTKVRVRKWLGNLCFESESKGYLLLLSPRTHQVIGKEKRTRSLFSEFTEFHSQIQNN